MRLTCWTRRETPTPDLAEVLLLAGKPDEAADALAQALARYERKGNRVSAQRAQTRLTELQEAAPR